MIQELEDIVNSPDSIPDDFKPDMEFGRYALREENGEIRLFGSWKKEREKSDEIEELESQLRSEFEKEEPDMDAVKKINEEIREKREPFDEDDYIHTSIPVSERVEKFARKNIEEFKSDNSVNWENEVKTEVVWVPDKQEIFVYSEFRWEGDSMYFDEVSSIFKEKGDYLSDDEEITTVEIQSLTENNDDCVSDYTIYYKTPRPYEMWKGVDDMEEYIEKLKEWDNGLSDEEVEELDEFYSHYHPTHLDVSEELFSILSNFVEVPEDYNLVISDAKMEEDSTMIRWSLNKRVL